MQSSTCCLLIPRSIIRSIACLVYLILATQYRVSLWVGIPKFSYVWQGIPTLHRTYHPLPRAPIGGDTPPRHPAHRGFGPHATGHIPQCNIYRGGKIPIKNHAAPPADELPLGQPRHREAADRTETRGAARIDIGDRNTNPPSFILYQKLQFPEIGQGETAVKLLALVQDPRLDVP